MGVLGFSYVDWRPVASHAESDQGGAREYCVSVFHHAVGSGAAELGDWRPKVGYPGVSKGAVSVWVEGEQLLPDVLGGGECG